MFCRQNWTEWSWRYLIYLLAYGEFHEVASSHSYWEHGPNTKPQAVNATYNHNEDAKDDES